MQTIPIATINVGTRSRSVRDCRIVVDCTEIFTESSSNYTQLGNMYSNYKSHSTVKVLIGVAPCGACMFVSDAFEGNISDKEIVKQSGFLDYLEKGDVVLADRGFLIEDLCLEKGAKLVIPPFLKNRSKFTREETVRTKLIARARIHVERFNQRLKTFKILQGGVPMSLVPVISQIIFVLCCLTNFQPPLAK